MHSPIGIGSMNPEPIDLPPGTSSSQAGLGTFNGKAVIELPMRKQASGTLDEDSSVFGSGENGAATSAPNESRDSNSLDSQNLGGGEGNLSEESGAGKPQVVPLWNPTYQMKVTGALCPTPENLSEFLHQHPNLEVYSGQDQVINAAKSFNNFDEISSRSDNRGYGSGKRTSSSSRYSVGNSWGGSDDDKEGSQSSRGKRQRTVSVIVKDPSFESNEIPLSLQITRRDSPKEDTKKKQEQPAPRGRGRPPLLKNLLQKKSEAAAAAAAAAAAGEYKPKRKKGRPRKNSMDVDEPEAETVDEDNEEQDGGPKKAGEGTAKAADPGSSSSSSASSTSSSSSSIFPQTSTGIRSKTEPISESNVGYLRLKYTPGTRIEGNYRKRGWWYPGKVRHVSDDAMIHVHYDDGGKERLAEGFIRPEDCMIPGDRV